MQETDIFVDLPQYNLNHYERDMLLQSQRSAAYAERKVKRYDGNLIAVSPKVPNWVFEKFELPLSDVTAGTEIETDEQIKKLLKSPSVIKNDNA